MILNRSSAYTGISVESAEEVLGRPIDYQVINEYRGAISALNSGSPFMVSRPGRPARSERVGVRQRGRPGTGRDGRPAGGHRLTR